MKKILYLICLILFICSETKSQQQFQKEYYTSEQSSAAQIIQTSDGGYAMIGTMPIPYLNYIFSLDGFGYIVKTNSSGDIEWSKIFIHEADSLALSFQCIIQCPDSSFIISGTRSDSSGGQLTGYYPLLLKLDKNGELLWSKTIIDSGNFGDLNFGKMYLTDNNSILILGNTDDNFSSLYSFGTYIAKSDLNGNLIWQKEASFEQLASIMLDNKDIIYSDGANLVKVDSSGKPIWFKQANFGGSVGPRGIIKTNDNKLLMVEINDFFSFQSIALTKIDTSGNVIWSKTYPHPLDDDAVGVIQTEDDGFIISATFTPMNYDVPTVPVFIKVDSAGSLQWIKAQSDSDAYVRSFIKTSDKGYAAAGQINFYNIYLLKTDSSFNQGCYFNDTNTLNDSLNAYTYSTNVFPTGYDSVNYSLSDYAITSIQSMSSIDICSLNGIKENSIANGILLYPNPMLGSCTLQLNKSINDGEIIIYDLLGNEIRRIKVTGTQVEIMRESLAAGIYVVNLKDGNDNYIVKMVVE